MDGLGSLGSRHLDLQIAADFVADFGLALTFNAGVERAVVAIFAVNGHSRAGSGQTDVIQGAEVTIIAQFAVSMSVSALATITATVGTGIAIVAIHIELAIRGLGRQLRPPGLTVAGFPEIILGGSVSALPKIALVVG